MKNTQPHRPPGASGRQSNRTALIAFVLAVLAIIVALWAIPMLFMRGPSLAQFDTDKGERFASARAPSAELPAALARLGKIGEAVRELPKERRLAAMRKQIDRMFADRTPRATITRLAGGPVAGEWVLAPGADPARRTLYLHGGAFTVGSPASHRTLTERFSELTGGAVLALDYRLMPEHPRMAGIEDSRAAYRWMLDNGPGGAGPAQTVFVAGDSAGASLALALLAWTRDQGLRAADAAVVLSPSTDATLSSPSMSRNVHSDAMLGPAFGIVAKLPQAVTLWGTYLQTGINPRDPVISPVFGDLSKLPPTLVHASETEMLFDDAVRYTNRARAAGSPVELQTWNNTLHVWHLFNPELPEAREALAEIGKFLDAAIGASQAKRAGGAR
ncbi:alpha/beta hydrolase fold domain-containing protein [Massilia glaciei]|uniref:Alpha/beta hydrolase n=1 Tax=Massilia glaciei TaxID=1524097 RepID=A0A2U2HK32_9BURK|nr:alpha/beta hydrolase fold domain-containing protein [Massilia glaciei]PWF47832.1 alpha/beta hydrolase [Massilia glaciei]